MMLGTVTIRMKQRGKTVTHECYVIDTDVLHVFIKPDFFVERLGVKTMSLRALMGYAGTLKTASLRSPTVKPSVKHLDDQTARIPLYKTFLDRMLSAEPPHTQRLGTPMGIGNADI